MIKKILILPVIILFAVIIASLFGIVHDQITYTISPEYYTEFKFSQFGLDSEISNNIRIIVSIVGIIATWWVGLILGIFFGLVSFTCTNWKTMLKLSIRAIALTVGITCITGILGYLYGKFILIKSDSLMNIYSINDFESFMIVGSIHTASYIGGFIGMILGSAYILINRNRFTQVPAQHQ